MDKEMRLLLAEFGLMATGGHCYQEAEAIASCLDSQGAEKSVVAMIRAMILMNRGLYEDAHTFLEPLCADSPDLVSLAALAAGKAGLKNQAEQWLEVASRGSEEDQAFAMSFSKDLRNLL
jgi:type III secretion protein G